MKGRIPHTLILGGSLAFLVSLYFTWTDNGLDGWSYFGQTAAVFAIALAGAALAALVRPHLANRLPFGKGALALGVFALLDLAALWQGTAGLSSQGIATGMAPASYAGLAGTGAVCLAAATMRQGELFRIPSPATTVGQVLSLGVIASFLLPALDSQDVTAWGPGPVVVCAFGCLSVWAWSQTGTQAARLAVAAALAVLVAGNLLPHLGSHAFWPRELWLLVACTAVLLAFSLVTARGLLPLRPTADDMAVFAAGVLLLVSLSLPWQEACSTGCVSGSGWELSPFAGACVLALLVGLVWLRRFLAEFAIGAAIFVAAAYGHNLRYSWLLGVAAATALLCFALLTLRPVPGLRFVVRLVPEAAAIAVLVLELAPLGGTRWSQFADQSPWQWLPLLSPIAAVATIRLLALWCGRPRHSAEVVLLPMGLLSLTGLGLIYVGTIGVGNNVTWHYPAISWQGWVSVVLCVVLVGCGWVERYGGGLERFLIPDGIWRVDRLPVVED